MRKSCCLSEQRTPRALPTAMLKPRLRGAARRAHGNSAKHAMRDLIASNAPLRGGRHTARQNGPKHYPGGFKGPPIGAPPKPNEVGLVGRGGAAERLSFCPKRQNEGCGACDDEACLSPLSFVVQRKMGPPEVASKVERPVKTQNKTIAPPEVVGLVERLVKNVQRKMESPKGALKRECK